VLIQNDAGGTLRGGGTSSAAIVVASDYATTVNNAGLIDGGSSGKAITLGSGQNTVLISGGQAQVLGDIDGGSGMANVLRLDPGVGNTFSYADALSGFASVRIESGTVTLSGVSHFTGTTTIAKGAVLELQGANRLAADSALELAGGRVVLAGAGAGVGQSFSALSLTGSSEMDLGGSTLSFGAIGSVSAGAQLSVTHGGLRFVGNQLGDASFQSLVAATLFDGVHAVARFDGTFTNISAVPEPNMAWLLAAGLVSFAALRRRQAR
jgi:autotransporter-associated beta strand protein